MTSTNDRDRCAECGYPERVAMHHYRCNCPGSHAFVAPAPEKGEAEPAWTGATTEMPQLGELIQACAEGRYDTLILKRKQCQTIMGFLDCRAEENAMLQMQLEAAQPASEPTPEPSDTPDGVALIAAERKRQIESEGWTPEHDDRHGSGSLAVAAACYALPVHARTTMRDDVIVNHVTMLWPRGWEFHWWKPGDRTRELVKAGALIAAEIDRLQRAAIRAAIRAERSEQ